MNKQHTGKRKACMMNDEAVDVNENELSSDDEGEDDEYDDDNDECLGAGKYHFMQEHPDYEFSYLQKLKHEAIPVISLPEDSICRIADLQMQSDNPSEEALEKWAMLLPSSIAAY